MRGAPDLFSRQPVTPAAPTPAAPAAGSGLTPAMRLRDREEWGWFGCEAETCSEIGCFGFLPLALRDSYQIGHPERMTWFCAAHRDMGQAVQS